MSSYVVLIKKQYRVSNTINTEAAIASSMLTVAPNIHNWMLEKIRQTILEQNMTTTADSTPKMTIIASMEEIAQYRQIGDSQHWLIVGKVITGTVSDMLADIVKHPVTQHKLALAILNYGDRLAKMGYYHNGFTIESLLVTRSRQMLIFDIWNIARGTEAHIDSFKYLVCKCAAAILGYPVGKFIVYTDNKVDLDSSMKELFLKLDYLRADAKKQVLSNQGDIVLLDDPNTHPIKKERKY